MNIEAIIIYLKRMREFHQDSICATASPVKEHVEEMTRWIEDLQVLQGLLSEDNFQFSNVDLRTHFISAMKRRGFNDAALARAEDGGYSRSDVEKCWGLFREAAQLREMGHAEYRTRLRLFRQRGEQGTFLLARTRNDETFCLSPTPFVHTTLGSAMDEAQRLSATVPGEHFRVLRLVGQAYTQQKQNENASPEA